MRTARPPAGHAADRLWTGAVIVAALGTGYVLKSFYSSATPEQLVWILAPTVSLLETLTGAGFVFEAYEGFLSTELNLLVAPACAGVNFLIATFCTGVLGLVGYTRTPIGRAALLLGCGAIGYVLTVVANCLRLLLALWLAPFGVWASIDPGTVHRVEGVFVYFTVLCVSFLVARSLLERRLAARLG